MIRVLFRTCDKVNSLHSLKRPFGLNKLTLIKACFRSVLRSLENVDFELTIVADDISQELNDWFVLTAPKAKIINEKMGNDFSLRRCFELAKDYPDEDIVYMVEDDYLHFYWTFDGLFDFIDKAKTDIFIHPSDYPDQYTRKDLIIPAAIFLGKYNHFRQVSSSTFTFMGRAKLFKKHYTHMISSCDGANDGFLSKIFEETPCFSPLPGLATHMHEGTMSPFMPWDKFIGDLL